MKKLRFLLLISLLILAMIFGSGCSKDDGISISKSQTSGSEDEGQTEDDDSDDETESASMISVFVCGQVKNPGVYELKKGSRIIDAINAAGGLKKKADYDSVNQAEKLEDAQQIYIPSVEEGEDDASASADSSSNASADSSLVSINHGTKEELMTLPGIGEAKADSIIAYREEHGAFSKIEDIMNITGIKEGVYSKIKDYITL